jgi:hypothetical protein
MHKKDIKLGEDKKRGANLQAGELDSLHFTVPVYDWCLLI